MKTNDKRKKKLLYLLSNTDDYLSADELGQALNVSAKTIYRLVRSVNAEVEGDTLILSERGRGYQLNYRQVNTLFKTSKTEGVTPIERRHLILEKLLLASPNEVSVMDVFEQLFVSEQLLASDEKIMAEMLQKYQLKLIRKNRALRIEGQERNIRQAISDLLNLTQEDLMDDFKKDLNPKDAQFVEKQMHYIEEKLKITLPYPYNVNIFSHLYILISRYKKHPGKILKDTEKLTAEQEEQLKRNGELWDVIETVIKQMNCYLHLQLPLTEHYYLYQYLSSSRMETIHQTANFSDDQTATITYFLLDEMGIQVNTNRQTDFKLFRQLYQHIKPMLNRLKHRITIKNGLLEQIKLEYPNIYIEVEQAVREMENGFCLDTINEDEIGYLVLYFAQYFEGNPEKISTLIMCTTGLGTSELLRVKIKQRFPQLKIVDVISSRNVEEVLLKHPHIELIISTIQLNQQVDIPTVVVSAMLSMNDQKRIEEMVKSIE